MYASTLGNQPLSQLGQYLVAFNGPATEDQRVEFIQNLRNAPNLKHLSFDYVKWGLDDMEALLTNAPNLKVLGLTDVYFTLNPKFNIKDIEYELYNNLEILVIEKGCFCDNANSYLRYFAKKITHFKNLVINTMEDNQYEGFYDKHTRALAEFITKLSRLEYYRVHAFKFTKRIAQAMDESGMRLKKIDLGGWDFPAAGFKEFVKCDQMKYIETFATYGQSLNRIGYDYKKRNGGVLKKFAPFPNIKHLRMIQHQNEIDYCKDNLIPLKDILEYLPNLESITMDFGTLVVDYDQDEPLNTKLKHIKLIEFYVEAPSRFNKDQQDYQKQDDYRKRSLNIYKRLCCPTQRLR